MATSTSIAAAIHGNRRGMPRNSTAIAMAILPSAMAILGNYHGTRWLLPRQFPRTSNHSNFHGLPWHSMAICGNCHGNPPTRGNCHGIQGNFHGNFHGRQSPAISTETHGIPRPSSAIATAILQYVAIATELHGNCHGGNCHGNFTDVNPLQFPRKTTAFHGHPRQLPRQSSNTR